MSIVHGMKVLVPKIQSCFTMYVCGRVPESQFSYTDVSGAVLLQFVPTKQTRPFAVEIKSSSFLGDVWNRVQFLLREHVLFACFLSV